MLEAFFYHTAGPIKQLKILNYHFYLNIDIVKTKFKLDSNLMAIGGASIVAE
jgi:hypothetical protein